MADILTYLNSNIEIHKYAKGPNRIKKRYGFKF